MRASGSAEAHAAAHLLGLHRAGRRELQALQPLAQHVDGDEGTRGAGAQRLIAAAVALGVAGGVGGWGGGQRGAATACMQPASGEMHMRMRRMRQPGSMLSLRLISQHPSDLNLTCTAMREPGRRAESSSRHRCSMPCAEAGTP